MKFQVIDAPQRSEAWFASRLGRLSGSRAKDILATIKSGEAAARRDYRMELVCERLTGQRLDEDGFVSKEMQRGIDKEPDAIAAYEVLTGNAVHSTGFLSCDDVLAGCSLDGHVDGFVGIIEVKVPKTATHLRYLRTRALPAEHAAQVVHGLWVSGAKWCDFVSFDDRLPEPLQLCVIRVDRDEAAIADYEAKALAFLAEVDAECEELRRMVAA